MVPALDWLDLNAAKFGLTRPDQFYWFTGALSAFLDNTPTYLSFLTTAFGLHGLNVDNINHMYAMLGLLDVDQLKDIVALHNSNIVQVTSESWRYIQAISASAVMFGATTYIGNGPNFMVKSIAEQSNIKNAIIHGIYVEIFNTTAYPLVYSCMVFIFLLEAFCGTMNCF